jgi:hypothetical protein
VHWRAARPEPPSALHHPGYFDAPRPVERRPNDQLLTRPRIAQIWTKAVTREDGGQRGHSGRRPKKKSAPLSIGAGSVTATTATRKSRCAAWRAESGAKTTGTRSARSAARRVVICERWSRTTGEVAALLCLMSTTRARQARRQDAAPVRSGSAAAREARRRPPPQR